MDLDDRVVGSALGLALGERHQGPLELRQPGVEPIDRAARPEPEVRCDLIVARAPGVQLARQRPDARFQRRFEVQVDVLEPGIPLDPARGDVRAKRTAPAPP